MKKKNGFTLIELLAVIIILGVLMIIAIPSVTKYIDDSRKNGYVSTAKSIVGGARNLIHSGSLELDDYNTTYYIDANCIATDNAYKSPYGDFIKAYVVVTASNDNYEYFWTSVDDAGRGVKGLINVNKLDIDNIEADINSQDITTDRGLDNRKYVVVVNEECQKGARAERTGSRIDSVTGGDYSPIKYPSGKTKETVVTGDLVTIGTQEFYVVKRSGDDLILLSHYNLNVGDNKKEDVPEGIQDSNVRGYLPIQYYGPKYGNVAFSNTNYWDGKVGNDYPGEYCSSYTLDTTCVYVYDSNSTLYPYVENYKTYLEGLGAEIKSARLLRVEEAFELGCEVGDGCDDAPTWVFETTYWLGSASDSSGVWRERAYNTFLSTYYGDSTYHGVRPVIVI